MRLDSADGLVVPALPCVPLRVWQWQYFIPIFMEDELKLRGKLFHLKSHSLVWVQAGSTSG